MQTEEYDQWFDTRTGRYVWSLELPLILEMLELKPGETLLDIGCGTGRLLQAVKNHKAMGIDQSSEMLFHAQKKANKYLVQGIAEALPFPDRSFDAVTLITVLEFVSDPDKVLREALRVCKDRLVLGVLNQKSLLHLSKRIKGIFARTSYKEACFQSVRPLQHLVESIDPDCKFKHRTTLAMPFHFAQTAWIERQLTKIGYPFGGFLIVGISPGRK